jgi:hypothetical protein
MLELLGDEIGDWAADALRAPFCIGKADQLADLLQTCFTDVTVQHVDGEARFTSLDEWLHTDIRGWTLADPIDDEQYASLVQAARARLSRFVR